jgi:hypothetical protein
MHPDPMQKSIQIVQGRDGDPAAVRRRIRGGWFAFAVCAAGFGVAAGAAILCAHGQSSPVAATTPTQTAANAQTGAPGEQGKPAVAAMTTGQQEKEIASECADLLKMATALKSEVDKTTKDTLSVTVVRKANEIEQLAHKARTGTPKS